MLSRLAVALALLAPPLARAADAVARETGLPFVQLFQRSDYRGHPQVWCGAADARGLLYFGNYGQVLVYDGVQWDRIAVPGATFVRALTFDTRGRLWVGGAGALGYIDTASHAPLRFVSLADRLPAAAGGPGDILRVHVLRETVYFQSSAWLFRCRGLSAVGLAKVDEAIEGWPLAEGGSWQSLLLGENFLLQNPQHGWWQVGVGGLELAGPALTRITPARFALPMTDDRWVVGTMQAGFFIYDGRALTRVTSDAGPYLSGHSLFNGIRLADGGYAMATRTGGVVLLSPNLSFQALIGDAIGLAGNSLNNIFADAHGGLWLCLDEGIARVAANGFSWLQPPPETTRAEGFALERSRGRLFLAAFRALVRFDAPADLGAMRWEPAARFDKVITALLTVDDTLLLTTGDGVYTLLPGTGDGVYVRREGVATKRIATLNKCSALLAPAAQPGMLLVVHESGIERLRRDGDRWTTAGTIGGVGGPVRSLIEDATGTVWATTVDGNIVRITFSPTASEPAVESFASEPGPTRVVRAGGRPLFLTKRGLQRFDPAKKRLVPEPAYGARFADGSTPVRAVAEERDGAVWIAPQRSDDTSKWSETTLGRATRDGGWQPLAIPDPTRIGDINGLKLEREGGREILWVGGTAGILRVDLAAIRGLPPAGATLLREAVAAGDRPLLPATVAGAVAIPHAANSVRFRVAAPGLAALPGVQFETELRGFEGGARHLVPSAEREFTNLWEGTYVFRARACAADGRWTTPVELAFTVLPPWWRMGWAYALWALLAVGGVAGIVTVRTRALRRRTVLLEATVAERTVELNARNQELTRLHKLELDEKISARLAEEKARLEVLRYQLNPHFLFNALNSICTQIMQQPSAARAMVVRLADFCRHTLHRPHAEESLTIGEELQLLRAYLDIEKARLGDLLVLEIAVEPGVESVRIPPFLLLPLVENAVKYGAATSRDKVRVRIAVRLVGASSSDAPTLLIEISNSGTWATPTAAGVNSTKIGLENLRQRLARYYPSAHEFTTEARDGWVMVRVKLNTVGGASRPDSFAGQMSNRRGIKPLPPSEP